MGLLSPEDTWTNLLAYFEGIYKFMNLSLLENIGQILLCLVVKSANDLMCIGRCKIDLMPIGPMHALI
jgi:hypothetical protein